MNLTTEKRIPFSFRTAIFTCLVVLLTNALCFVLLVLMWGKNQDLSIDSLSRLRRNMLPEQCALALNMRSGLFNTSLGERAVQIADSGIGAWFVPQNQIVLEFNAENKLVDFYVERHYQIDEYRIDVKSKEF